MKKGRRHELMRMSQSNNCTVLRDASGKCSGQLPHFLPQASHAVDQSRCAAVDVSTRPHLLDDVVIRFDIQLDSFRVSTSSAIAFRCCRCFASRTHAPHSRIIGSKLRIVRSRLAIDRPSIFQTSTTHSQTHSTRLPGSFVSRITLSLDTRPPFDLTPDLWRSAFTGSVDSVRSQPFLLLLLQLLRLLNCSKHSKDPGLSAAALCCNGSIHQDVSSPSIHRDVLHHLLLLLLQPSLTNMFRPFADFPSRQWFRECIC